MNATLTKIYVESLQIDNNLVPAPVGLSELLTYVWVPEKQETEYLQQYDRKVTKRNDGYVTYLKKK